MSMVLAVREGRDSGAYFGFRLDHEILECSECTEAAAYRIRYTEDQQGNLAEHRVSAHRVIESEHPNHSDVIRLG